MVNHKSCIEFVHECVDFFEYWLSHPPEPTDSILNHKTALGTGPKVAICPAHPDDECLSGPLPLRLQEDLDSEVIVIPATLGSRRDQRQRRLQELYDACGHLGYRILLAGANDALENINPHNRAENPEFWERSVRAYSKILIQEQPEVILTAHPADHHPTHVGTHHLVIDSLRYLEKKGQGMYCAVVLCEYWANMNKPNLLLECSTQHLADLVSALSCHRGEVSRNPYHVELPCWLMDSVRRGAETVGGLGAEAPNFIFGTLHRVMKWTDGQLVDAYETGKIISVDDSIEELILATETATATV